MVRVVRPGEDAEAVLDEARQQLAASSGRRRRRGSRGGRSSGGRSVSASTVASQSSSPQLEDAPAEEAPLLVEITPLEMTPVPEAAVSITPSTAESPAEVAPQDTNSNGEETRLGRRRRRSSATAG